MNTIKKRDKDIGSLIVDMIDQSPKIKSGLTDVKVEEIFRSEMGEIINKYTSNISFYDGVLKLRITSAPLKNELRHSKQILIKRLNLVLGFDIVKEIILI